MIAAMYPTHFAQHARQDACTSCQTVGNLHRKASSRIRSGSAARVQAFWPFSQAKKAPSAAAVKDIKSRLTQLAGKKYGHDLSETQKQEVRKVLQELEDIGPGDIRRKDLLGTEWTLLYTESSASSGGKVGPFVGQVDQAITLFLPLRSMMCPPVCISIALVQIFPEDRPGVYVNRLKLGPITADLAANYVYSSSKQIDVSFIDIAAYLGSLRLIQKVGPVGSQFVQTVTVSLS